MLIPTALGLRFNQICKNIRIQISTWIFGHCFETSKSGCDKGLVESCLIDQGLIVYGDPDGECKKLLYAVYKDLVCIIKFKRYRSVGKMKNFGYKKIILSLLTGFRILNFSRSSNLELFRVSWNVRNC